MNDAIHDRLRHLPRSLYQPDEEHDSCGVGFVASVDGVRSGRVLRYGLTSVCNMVHRGAVDADAKTGDGSGIMTQIPYKIFRREISKLGHSLYRDSDLGVGSIFLPHDNAYAQARAKSIVEEVLEYRGLYLFGWREVHLKVTVLGDKAQSTMPRIEQVLIGRTTEMSDDEYERVLFLARKEIEKRVQLAQIRNFYIVSFSSRTIIYKGLLTAVTLEKFYRDLSDPDYETAICVFHERYSTNTFPTWPLSQPFRFLGHNGEINTIRGNRNWMAARESELEADFWKQDIDLLRPIIQPGGSDSASLDNALEVLTMSGRDLLHAVTMLVPPAWRTDETMSADLKAYYEYHRCFNEPWDGPAGLVFSNGVVAGACLDRNGLRPARYKLTSDGIFTVGSEVGSMDLEDARVIEKGRLAPGEMIAVDTRTGKLLRDAEIKNRLATQKPYLEWVNRHLIRLQQISKAPAALETDLDILGLAQQQVAFGYSSEELDFILKPMAKDGQEPVGSMGDDTPLAVLSLQPRLLYTYFKQLFAQVTNPPIDPIREKLVMSLATNMGWQRNLLGETPEHAQLVFSESPILLPYELAALRSLTDTVHRSVTIDLTWPIGPGAQALDEAIERISAEAEAGVDQGARLVILNDLAIDANRAAVPMLLAVGAIHHHLTRAGKRMRCSLIAESGEARDVHQIACVIGYGASAVCPVVAYETLREMVERGMLGPDMSYDQAVKNYRSALEKGLLKIMSKMGISVVGSYRGAQVFEAIGLSTEIIDRCFAGTPSKIEGIGLEEIAEETLVRHQRAFAEPVPLEKSDQKLDLDDPGYYRYRRQGEQHAITPPVIKSFHAFVKTNKAEDYSAYVAAVKNARPASIRDLLELVPPATTKVSVDDVEPIEEIRRRFTTAGMSLGALSPEAHECLAIAMNRIGGKSNSGEGGEDPARFHRRPNGDWPNSAIKQIAQGRFGVTASYLAAAKEIEIKMAQGAKPGEGGQLPGHKVTELIARLRKSTPGVTLISPPPHHDIYSIEDLAQLIYDLKQVNPRAKVCVKLVAEAGVGTIAAGVAKAHADIILISGHDGGTGASPLSSIKNAGSAWELGVAEAHQVLMLNGLRNRIVLRTDGGMRTGEDIVFAALLGAEEFNFGTTALIASGCVYVRQCHLNTCPVGVATQDERLRAKFKGKPENIVNYFNAVAQEVREIMARLGVSTFTELVGRVEHLRQRHIPDHPKANKLQLGRLLTHVAKDDDAPRFNTWDRNDPTWGRRLDDSILQDAQDAVNDQMAITLNYRVKNTNRAVGTKLSGEIAYLWGESGLPEGTITLNLRGSAGQSLGAFLSPGVKIHLVGEANDYVGKGMSGGEITLKPSPDHSFLAHQNSIVGNTCLYGATGGRFFAAGRAGERFAVRNSGVTAVVEGIGDHGCEYMTRGTVLVIGNTGKNFGAGMTGGVAYVLDLDQKFPVNVNRELVVFERLENEDEATLVKALIYEHLERTESARAKELLAEWTKYQPLFWSVYPKTAPKTQEPVKLVTAPADAAPLKT